MHGGPFVATGLFLGHSPRDSSGGLCLTMFLPWIMFHSGVMVEMNDLISNFKAIVFRAMVDNLLTLACVSVGTYYIFPIIGIHSLEFKDHLIIGAIFMPNNFMIKFPAYPFPVIELLDDHSIIFGEGALGIALSLMLLKHVKSLHLLQMTTNSRLLLTLCGYMAYMLVASSLLGFSIGLLFSFRGFVAKFLVSKYFDSDYHLPFVKGATFVLFIPAYLSYILAEYLNFSGTLCVFAYGVAAANYILPKDPKGKARWRDDIHRIFTIRKWMLMYWVGATSRTMNLWKTFENRPGMLMNVSAVLLVNVIFGKLVSIIPLSWRCIRQKEYQNKLATDLNFANPWMVDDLTDRWTIAKTKIANHNMNPFLFDRWGLSKIEPQVMILATAENAETYMGRFTLGCALMPSMLSYIFAYDQFNKSDDDRLALVHIGIVIVYLSTSTLYSLWDYKIVWDFEEQTQTSIFCKFDLFVGRFAKLKLEDDETNMKGLHEMNNQGLEEGFSVVLKA